jgi:hypothetical protein
LCETECVGVEDALGALPDLPALVVPIVDDLPVYG